MKTLYKIDDEIDQPTYEKLGKEFTENCFEDAVVKAENYLTKSYNGTYDQFLSDVKSTQKSNSCLSTWSTSTLSGVCLDCQILDSSCLCIPCFLAKHHEKHRSFITYYPSGSCDCGDPTFLTPSGFCQKIN